MAKQLRPPKAVEKTLPVAKFRHRNLVVAVWKNSTSKGPMYSVTITRSFNESNLWKESHNLNYDDLMNVAKLLSDAHSWISAERIKDAAARKAATSPQGAPAAK